ncbi:hypothetical protein [Nocardia abscessus]|nr:hypothetical protein [Nocardia abscessus]
MKVTVFGATGAIGSLTVDRLLAGRRATPSCWSPATTWSTATASTRK